jgi:hypothetical protein
VHDLAFLEVVASQQLRFEQVNLLLFGQQLAKPTFAQLCHAAQH